jgi:hypothetical protein
MWIFITADWHFLLGSIQRDGPFGGIERNRSMRHLDPLGAARKICLLGIGLSLAFTASLLHAGSVISLKDTSEAEGKLTLNSNAVHIETSGGEREVKLGDILEADFSDSPFQVNYFSSRDNLKQLPPNWKAQDIGNPPAPGKSSYANGTFTVTGSGSDIQRPEKEDQLFFMGQPWKGNGQFTVRLKEIAPADSPTMAGPMLRDSLDALAAVFGMGMSQGDAGLYLFRNTPGDHIGWAALSAEIPSWLRLTWIGASIDSSISTDGKTWELVNQSEIKTTTDHWIGLFVRRGDKQMGTGIFDQLTLTPPSAEPATLSRGILLQSGSFLVGAVDWLNQHDGSMTYNGKPVALSPDQVAAVITHPVTERQITDAAAKPGLIMENGDFLESDIQLIQGSLVQTNSVVLGSTAYYGDMVRASVLHPIKLAASDYEVRLKDGSIIRAKSFDAVNGQIVIGEASGVTITVDPVDIAQFRAGSAHVQNLIDLAWKAKSRVETSVPKNKTTKSTPPAAIANAATVIPSSLPGANDAVAASPAHALTEPDANPAPDLLPPDVETWQGLNQEQMIVVTAGSMIDFPLSDKFRALSLRIALSPDSPPNAEATLRILVNGREVARTPPAKTGAAPRLVEINLHDPKTLTFAIDSSAPNARLLVIDPVAVRDTGAP